MMSLASLSSNENMFCMYASSVLLISPLWSLCVMMILSSSSEWACSVGTSLNPIILSTSLDVPFMDQMSGFMMTPKKYNGPENVMAIFSAYCIATVFGASSPTTTCMNVTMKNAAATVNTVLSSCGRPKNENSGCSMTSNVDSPIHPSPSAVTVIPS